MDLTAAAKNCFMELNELMELRDNAYENTWIYKEGTKKWQDSRLRGDKDFKVEDMVLLFNSRFKMHLGKLDMYGYSKNHMKTIKNGQTRTRERKSVQELEAKVKKSTPGQQNKAVHEERGDSVERAATTATSLNAEQDSGNITRTPPPQQFLMFPLPHGIGSSGRPSAKLFEDDANMISAVADEVSYCAPVTTSGVICLVLLNKYSSTTTTIIEDENLTIAQTLMKMKSEKSKVRGVTMQEPSETATRPTIPPPQHDRNDKGKAKMVEPEKPLKRKDQIKFDEEVAQRLQAQMHDELEEEERLAKQREEDANIAEWDDVQAMMDADYKLAARLQAEEQGGLTVEENSRLFVELMNERKKHFARLREKEQRRKPLTKAQKRNQMCTYLKNMEQVQDTLRPEEKGDKLLWGDLMSIFEPSEEDELWKNQQDYTLI
ncbi:hypothetical protein Tco_1087035, partial [Tanacetum coccineum]